MLGKEATYCPSVILKRMCSILPCCYTAEYDMPKGIRGGGQKEKWYGQSHP